MHSNIQDKEHNNRLGFLDITIKFQIKNHSDVNITIIHYKQKFLIVPLFLCSDRLQRKSQNLPIAIKSPPSSLTFSAPSGNSRNEFPNISLTRIVDCLSQLARVMPPKIHEVNYRNSVPKVVTQTAGQRHAQKLRAPIHRGINLFPVLLIALVTTGAILLGLLAVCVGMACFRHPGRKRQAGDRRAMIPGTGGDTSSEGSVTDLAIPHHVPHVLPPPPQMIAPLPPNKRPVRKIGGKPRQPPRKATMVPASGRFFNISIFHYLLHYFSNGIDKCCCVF